MKINVVAVSRSTAHTFSKDNQGSIRLIAGLGVEGDTHPGIIIQAVRACLR